MSYLQAGIITILCILIAPLLDGIMRKWRARIHSRMGPPIHQTYLDLLKLFGKEDISRSILAVLYIACVASATFILALQGDLLSFVYLLTASSVCLVLYSLSMGNPFGVVGGGREVMMFVIVEPVMAAAFLSCAIKAGSFNISHLITWGNVYGVQISSLFAILAMFLAMQAQMGKLPFDLAEAETELIGGVLLEASGPTLALFKWGLVLRQLLIAYLIAFVFIPWPGATGASLFIFTAIKTFIILFLATTVEALFPRLRIDQALGFYARVLIAASFMAIAFSTLGV
ncbi:NADH-quinone oxidoreductase subunit H [bacterium]|nr:NADH-quinone oxidoreductase subunit H [bacterium]